jgi:hypothetical protein
MNLFMFQSECMAHKDHLPSNDENLIKDTTFGMAAMLFEQLEGLCEFNSWAVAYLRSKHGIL